ncbi:MAG: YdeI/OmpD-associated family protein [Pseudomonadota bacterium]
MTGGAVIQTDNFEKVEIASTGDLRTWLTDNHGQEASVWLVTWKKTTPDKYVSTGEVLDELLCFGWIDGIRRKLDDDRTMQLIAPRRVQHWSKTYKYRAARLEAEGRMTDAGRAAIAASKANGSWSFLDDVDALIVPDDLATALTNGDWEGYAPSYRRNVLRWIKLAKTPATRAKRVAEAARATAEGRKIPQM